MRLPRIATALKPLAWTALLGGAVFAADPEFTLSGGSSVSFGYIRESSDTSSYKYSGNRMQALGAQVLLKAKMSPEFVISAGLGIVERHYLSGSIGNTGGRTPFINPVYPVQADFNYAWFDREGLKLALTGGYFPYSYNPEVKNLGLYLLRGPVYPGILVGGFETKHTRPVANNLGLRLQHIAGGFEHNLIINSETETFPLYDISPAYIAQYRFGQAFKIGAGVNFSHILPMDRRLTNPQKKDSLGSDIISAIVSVDTVTHDSTYMSFAGTKVMADAVFDPKAFFGSEIMGPDDLKLYAEVAVIGLDQSAPYKRVYGDLKRRMPVMVGFNFPMFRILDHLSLEVEWYGSRVKDDLSRYQASTGNFYSPLPVDNNLAKLDLAKDDWKWSLHAERKLGQFRFSGQVASDHSRPGGIQTSPSSEWEAYFIKPSDWYWVLKAGFFF